MRITFIWKPSWFANSFWTLQSCQDAESISNRKYLQRLLKMSSWECLICHYSMTAQLIYSHSCLFIGKSFACDDTNTFQERIYSNSKSKMFKIVISRKSQKRKGLKYSPYIVGFQLPILYWPYNMVHILNSEKRDKRHQSATKEKTILLWIIALKSVSLHRGQMWQKHLKKMQQCHSLWILDSNLLCHQTIKSQKLIMIMENIHQSLLLMDSPKGQEDVVKGKIILNSFPHSCE